MKFRRMTRNFDICRIDHLVVFDAIVMNDGLYVTDVLPSGDEPVVGVGAKVGTWQDSEVSRCHIDPMITNKYVTAITEVWRSTTLVDWLVGRRNEKGGEN